MKTIIKIQGMLICNSLLLNAINNNSENTIINKTNSGCKILFSTKT